MAVIIATDMCTGCGLCAKHCPYGVVDLSDGPARIMPRCTSCGACLERCPVAAITTDLIPRPLAGQDDGRNIWVLAQIQDGVLSPTALELLGCARRLADILGQATAAIVLGTGAEKVVSNLAAHGADLIYYSDHPALRRYQTLPFARVLHDLIIAHRPAIFLIPATPLGRDLAPRVARRLNLGLTADCTALDIGQDGGLVQTRPAFGGNVMATIVSPYARPQMATVRPGIMTPAPLDPTRTASVEKLSPIFSDGDMLVNIREVVQAPRPTVNFHQAKVIVSGGRGVGLEGFGLLAELAQALGAELGGTRVAVEEGWIPPERQIGQTGQTVRPELYIACGLSGAIQHRAGILEARYIAAINRDPRAPIFDVADFQIVGDLFQIVPALIRLLRP